MSITHPHWGATHLLSRVAVPGREDVPLEVLQRNLNFFACCQEQECLLLGLAKSQPILQKSFTVSSTSVWNAAHDEDFSGRLEIPP